ncbi:MAG: hypothetical protein J07HQW1_02938 [Haloquadratum walsbyi J07HQW1]|uniref:Uncharacterized protein n=1 Tax=Haloquadratum walsbyi J07HQW1 TaxID=1238424 RepID=U1MRY9_9EURY|nr:MAG: hypothetical protein J07HQW1_02938 [Haloquadratum walsbyi J07HQW1]
MPVSLDDESRVSIPSSVLTEIAALTRTQSEHVQTELQKITSAGYTPSKFVYKQYGDLKVFRCGDDVRMFGVILENIEVVDEFDHLVILLEVSEHDYQQAGVTKTQAREIQRRFGTIESEDEFWDELEGSVFDYDDITSIFE